jgi:hemerythrin-like domain-containing protein
MGRAGLRRPPKRVMIPLAAGLVTAARRARRRRQESRSQDRPTDVGYMRAMHNALRRDLDRLESAAAHQGETSPVPPVLRDGWLDFRARLDRHHVAEDEDLWPVLRRELATPQDQLLLDRMVEQHHALSDAIATVDDALTRGAGAAAPLATLADGLRDHLDDEEHHVLPLLERHLSRAQWRAFLVTERGKTPPRERPEFLGWVLHEATDVDRQAVLAELPAPGRLVYRHIIGPRYAARRRQADQRQRKAALRVA